MTTAIPKTTHTIDSASAGLELREAQWNDIVKVLSESHAIWGSGLSCSQYFELTSSRLDQPWARRNYRFLSAYHGERLVASCKFFKLELAWRGKTYRLAGLGAVYTQDEFRCSGYASRMLKIIEKRCFNDNFDGLLLFSEIDPAFYERLGYECLSTCDFHIWLTDPIVQRQIMSDISFAEDMHEYAPDVSSLESRDIPHLIRHYRRYLARQTWGMVRDEAYANFKIHAERFRQTHIAGWPGMEMMSIGLENASGGYALFEHSGQIMRVLEIIGAQPTRELLWRHLMRTALLRGVQLVRGWESVAPTFLKGLKYADRDWGQPMLLCLNDELEKLLDFDDCPLLELDHF